ncbi:RNA polymerase sigma factor [Maribellus maritimus]|uniref:RNA polymerase sigma factor n=1 Tax=Maribellus maritimus TaxID=2870838 RepID=UPI001EEA9332|nr:sigma-70 family RNA polymerase sigma factor [Maribellus maritimus]MCG6186063.1 sigma-70 family RNA polymerase sigma factor [Maribellus maritimus]
MVKTEHVEQTFRKQNKSLLNYIRQHLPLEQAEDVLQDVFIQFFSSYEHIRSVENISSWLYKTAINRVIDLKRKKKPDLFSDKEIKNSASDDEVLHLEDILPTLNDGPEEDLFRKIIWEEIEEALDELPEEQREVFVLHEFENRSFREISRISGEKVNTLISRKRYAVVYLREKLKGLYQQLKQ